jgi:uncharacterized protein YndB with AHSA1/START domain
VTQALSSENGRSVLRMQRRLKHRPEKVWAALVEPDRLAEWFPTTARPEPRVGGTVEFGFGPSGTVTDYEPPTLIAYTWGDDHLRWEVEPDGDGALLRLVHTFADRAGGASFAAGWHTCIAALAGDDPGQDMTELHERYVTELGLDEPAVDALVDGWRVRLERQLTRPGEAVWPDLAGAWPGTVVVAEEPKVLEVEVADGRVRYEFGEGTGQGARLTVTWTGADPAARNAAAARVPEVAAALSHTGG